MKSITIIIIKKKKRDEFNYDEEAYMKYNEIKIILKN